MFETVSSKVDHHLNQFAVYNKAWDTWSAIAKDDCGARDRPPHAPYINCQNNNCIVCGWHAWWAKWRRWAGWEKGS